jgi:hypothetical protein
VNTLYILDRIVNENFIVHHGVFKHLHHERAIRAVERPLLEFEYEVEIAGSVNSSTAVFDQGEMILVRESFSFTPMHPRVNSVCRHLHWQRDVYNHATIVTLYFEPSCRVELHYPDYKAGASPLML